MMNEGKEENYHFFVLLSPDEDLDFVHLMWIKHANVVGIVGKLLGIFVQLKSYWRGDVQ